MAVSRRNSAGADRSLGKNLDKDRSVMTMASSSSENRIQTLPSFWGNYRAILTLPVFLLVLIAALDSADKALLAASFPALEKTLGLNVETLGYFSLFTNLSYALSLPFWGWLVHRFTHANAHSILSASCCLWGLATLLIASSTSFWSQALFRSVNGAALASILPLSQMMLVELVPSFMRGRAFGVLGFAERVAATLATASVIWFEDWRFSYVAVGVASIAMAILSGNHLKSKQQTNATQDSDNLVHEKQEKSLSVIFKRIARTPAFLFLVAQGVFGAIPWDMMSFVLLLLDWRLFSKEEIVALQCSAGVFGTIGAALGGFLGDWFGNAKYASTKGRIGVALVSVVGGIAFWGLFLFSTSFNWAFLWYNLFHLWGGWTPAAAIRPICADLAKSPSERAQVVAAWILLEKTSSAIFGAPLVGYLTKHMMEEEAFGALQYNAIDKAHALAFNLFALSTLFWGFCAMFWLVMGRALDSSVGGIKGVDDEDESLLIKDSEMLQRMSQTRLYRGLDNA